MIAITRSALLSRLAPVIVMGTRKVGAALLAAALLSVGSAAAQQSTAVPSYDVELLIFRNLSERGTPEEWAVEAGGSGQQVSVPEDEQGSSAEVIEAPPPSAPTVTFPTLPASKMKLNAIEESLRRGRAYQLLAHVGWTQPGFARNGAKYLSLNSLLSSAGGLQGQVALTRGRYLHLTLDLVLDSAAAPGESPQRFVLRQTRRMRSNERHYIDSPKFGVIAVITPAD